MSQKIKDNLSIYIHYPFCKAKCPYCDFNSHVMQVNNEDEWIAAYLSELEYFYQFSPNAKIASIFFGGGTPSLMPLNLIEKILQKIYDLYEVATDVEISLEANPTSSEASKFINFRNLGINRLSLGIQALNDLDLKFLGREHSAKEAIKTINLAKKYFVNFSFDLIYARPEQTLNSWGAELKQALAFTPPHLSLYQLTIEKGTKFFTQYKNKEFKLASDAELADFYEFTESLCAQSGLYKYEISNYAQANFEAKHNLNYWQYGNYIGIGAGAHGRIRIANAQKLYFMTFHQPHKWLTHIQQNGNAVQQKKILSKQEILEEILMLGLRIKSGIKSELFTKYLGKNHIELFAAKLLHLKEEGLIKYNKHNLSLTKKGHILINSIIGYLIN